MIECTVIFTVINLSKIRETHVQYNFWIQKTLIWRKCEKAILFLEGGGEREREGNDHNCLLDYPKHRNLSNYGPKPFVD